MSRDHKKTVNAVAFQGLPSFFQCLVYEAATRRYGYSNYAVAGTELARHTFSYMDNGEKPGTEVEVRYEKLEQSIQRRNALAVLKWYKREFPRCLALIPYRRRRKFVEGVFFAWEEGIMD
ncbi:MAG: hypothetical protein HY547_07205 [Elusimicrobia bacterium]|nr:hypothetical protein [Elusimicrobiota bacterium]